MELSFEIDKMAESKYYTFETESEALEFVTNLSMKQLAEFATPPPPP